MVKTFSDMSEPIEVEFIDREGNKTIKIAKFISVKEAKEIAKMVLGEKEQEDNFDILQKQIAYIFGGKLEDYENYSVKLLKGVLDYVTEQIVGPTNKEQEKEKK